MKTKNFATSGLFANGEFINADSMNEIMGQAQSCAERNPNIWYNISWMVFSEGEHIEITEGVNILRYTNINGEVYITN